MQVGTVGQATADEIQAAARTLHQGGLVAFPTETVYGLGADAGNPSAVARIFAAKGRPADHPLIVHLADARDLSLWAADPPELAWRLAERFWPGPLTLVLRRSPRALDCVTGGQATVGLRAPQHPVAQALLRAFGGGVAAPSANRFGRISPTRAEHVRDEFPGGGFPILAGGACTVGLESTIVDLSGPAPTLLRPGAITREMLTQVAGQQVAEPTASSPRASGRLASHYAPQAPLRLTTAPALAAAVRECLARGVCPAVIARPDELAELARDLGLRSGTASAFFPVPWPGDSAARAAGLYEVLRTADASGAEEILLAGDFTAPSGGIEEAIADRLRRAAVKDG